MFGLRKFWAKRTQGLLDRLSPNFHHIVRYLMVDCRFGHFRWPRLQPRIEANILACRGRGHFTKPRPRSRPILWSQQRPKCRNRGKYNETELLCIYVNQATRPITCSHPHTRTKHRKLFWPWSRPRIETDILTSIEAKFGGRGRGHCYEAEAKVF